MAVTHAKVSGLADGDNTDEVRPSDWNAAHTVSIVNADVSATAAIAETKLALTNVHPSGASTHYTGFESDGTLVMHGNATVWEDLRVEPTVRGTGQNNPAFEKYLDNSTNNSIGVYLYSFPDEAANSENEVYFSMQMPHQWASTPIYIHVHWIGSTSDTTAAPRWGLEYAWVNIGGTYTDSTIIYAVTKFPVDADVTALKHYLTQFAAIDPSTTANGLSSVLIGRLFRNSSDAADTYNVGGNKCGLLYIDAHYEADTLGSRSELAK